MPNPLIFIASKDYGYGVGWWSDGIPEAALINDPDMGFEEYTLTQLKIDLYTVQKLLGHKTNVMTQRYAHLSENRLRDAAMALGAAWIKQEPTEEGVEEASEAVNFTK